MEPICHRCNGTVEPDSFYCQNCGAPQVRFVAPDQTSVATEEASPGNDAHALREAISGGSIQWRQMIRIAAGVALGVGILSNLLAAGSVLWVAAGAVIVIGIYRRRQPRARFGRAAGARVGALVGLMTAAVALAGNAVFLVIQRYGMHQGSLIDSQLDNIVKQAAQRAATMDPQAPVAAITGFWLSAEGRIGLILLTMGFLALLIFLFAIAGGMLGAQIYRAPRGRNAIL